MRGRLALLTSILVTVAAPSLAADLAREGAHGKMDEVKDYIKQQYPQLPVQNNNVIGITDLAQFIGNVEKKYGPVTMTRGDWARWLIKAPTDKRNQCVEIGANQPNKSAPKLHVGVGVVPCDTARLTSLGVKPQ